MKKLLPFVIAALLAVVALIIFAPTAKAQGRQFDRSSLGAVLNRTMDLGTDSLGLLGRRYCENHRGTGDQVEASWCYGDVYDNNGRYEGYNPMSVRGQRRTEMLRWASNRDYAVPRGRYNGYDRRYDGRGLSHRDRNTIIGVAAGVGVLYAVKEFVIDPRNEKKREAMAETRHQEVLAALRAREAQINGDEGSEADAQEEIPQTQAPTKTPRTVFKKNGLICNNTNQAVVIVVDGDDVHTLSPGKAIRVADLPQGKVEWRLAR
ncbi:MAG: hypothetical protein IT405_01230 [Candidatus Yanofskybacteria bacterium]|nr:hypothetical protein [Candidatus Yanofskybacteria bacterium]